MNLPQIIKQSDLAFNVEPASFSNGGIDEEDYIFEVKGKINLWNDEVEDEPVGSFVIRTIDIASSIEDGCSLRAILDSSSDTREYIDLLNEDGSQFSEPLSKTLGDRFHWHINPKIDIPSILILDKLAIDPNYRGNGYGLSAIDAIMRRFRIGADLIVMFPYPLQYIDYSNKDDPNCQVTKLEEKWSKPTKLSTDVETDSQKLQAYYARLGFVPVKGTKLMVRPPYLRVG
jgi:GNAT superfamily N-acetyltransferase